MPQKRILYVSALLAFAASTVFLTSWFRHAVEPTKVYTCTMDAKICPDGSEVGRGGPNCEFIECPLLSDEPADEFAQTLSYGTTTLRLGETAAFADISITPVRIVEDSRCPKDVACIWTGTVSAEFRFASYSGVSVAIVNEWKTMTIDNVEVSLLSALPHPRSSMAITQDDYRLTLSVLEKGQTNLTETPQALATSSSEVLHVNAQK